MEEYGLLGKKLSHSFSPAIHALLGDYPYRLIELEEDELPGFMRENHFKGFNVTIPYKEKVITYLSKVSPLAADIGSVNTVIRQSDGSLFGDNTDAWGFEKLLGDSKRFVGKKALVLGSGGSSKTVQAVLRNMGIEGIVISRSGENHYENLSNNKDAALIINTTPLGMYPNNDLAPLSLSIFWQCRLVIDLIYNPYRTKLLQQADKLGIEGRGGLLMLAAQAQRASELWDLSHSGDDRSMEIAEKLSRDMRNLVLIGMPGSGKTAIAKSLKRLTGRQIFDSDTLIEQKTGKSIPKIIEHEGIAAFRLLETEILREVSKLSGVIIAAGGGVVTQPQNLPLLMQNSRIIWIKRDLNLLSTSGRPLSQSSGVEALYQQREALYAAWSERAFENTGIDRTAKEIAETML
ncbi:MAG: shikimate kinase [Clostridiales bacterium]|nr:shikimate kinase [Clostridiales bacterium]